jgi:hypothetical protein
MGACTAPDARLEELLLLASGPPTPPPVAPAGTKGFALTFPDGTKGLAPTLDPAVGLLRPGGGTKLGALSPGGGCGDEGLEAIAVGGRTVECRFNAFYFFDRQLKRRVEALGSTLSIGAVWEGPVGRRRVFPRQELHI